MILFVVVGMPASGKNIARSYAESKRIPYFATGDVVRGEVKRQGLEPNAENTAMISTQLRGADGMGVTRLVLSRVIGSKSALVFMEGIRSLQEVKLIREKVDCVVVAFVAPRKLRLERIMSRGRSDDSAGAFDDRDMREIAYGAAVPVALADGYILNTRSMEDAMNDLDNIVKNYV
jgi:dephospho-CoA kinase